MKEIALTVEMVHNHFNQYIDWLKEETCIREVRDGWVEITTPHLDRHNDCLQIYIKNKDKKLFITDGGYIIDDLEASGVKLSTPKRKNILQEILNGFGVAMTPDNQLTITATQDDFAIKKNNILQAMLSVNDMFSLAQNSVQSLFFEDVEMWLQENDIRYVPSARFIGKSGFDHMYDFVIPKHREHPERLLQSINIPNKSNIENLLFRWSDTQATRPQDSRLYAIMNDVDNTISQSINQSLENYNVIGIPWSQRGEFTSVLAA